MHWMYAARGNNTGGIKVYFGPISVATEKASMEEGLFSRGCEAQAIGFTQPPCMCDLGFCKKRRETC